MKRRASAQLLGLWLLATASLAPFAQARERVDIAVEPWQATGQVNVPGLSRCTGVLVAPRRAVTAAHCLFDRSTGRYALPESVHFVLGYDRGSFGFVSTASAIRFGSDASGPWGQGGTRDDWAVIELAEAAPETFQPIAIAQSPQDGAPVAIAGFGRDRAYALTAARDCVVNGEGASSGLLVLACDIVSGYSGGPVIDRRGELVGIVVATGRDPDRPVAFAVPAPVFADPAG